MQKTEKFFIFSWKELTVIALLIMILIGFFFTLGLHYGKNLQPLAQTGEQTGELSDEHGEAAKLEESPEAVPPKDQLDKAAQHAAATTQETIKSATQEEVGKSGLKVTEPKPVDLPSEKTVGKNAKAESKNVPAESHIKTAPTGTEHAEAASEESAAQETPKYAIQLGSYTSKKEAQGKIKTLQKRGLHPEIRLAVVSNQTRYRVVLPGFKTRISAEQRGKELRSKKKIENFVVIKSE